MTLLSTRQNRDCLLAGKLEICTAPVLNTNQIFSAIPLTRGFSCSHDRHRTKYCTTELSFWWITRFAIVLIGIFRPIWACQPFHEKRPLHATYNIKSVIVMHVGAVLAVVGRPGGSSRIGRLISIRYHECAVFTCFRDIIL